MLVLENCELLVIFKDGEKRFIDDVELYGHNSGSDVFWFEKNDKRCFSLFHRLNILEHLVIMRLSNRLC